MSRRIAWMLTACLLASIGSFAQVAQKPAAPTSAAVATRITSPKEEFGHNFGDDYFLANYQQISAYWKKLAKQSDRIVLEDIGKTAEGRTQLMAIVTSPANQKKLAHYKQISQQLAHADGVTDAQARALVKEGKTVVWIDGGLHATEVLGAQQLGEMVYQFVSRTDDETMRMLNDCIILFVHANPDGNDLTADWYMRNPVPEQRTMNGLPKLYQKYIGHDNNRDFFGSTQAETENMNRVLYREWFPQIVYNHHQSGPAGTVLWSPPLRDPFNYNQDPLLVLGIQTVGLALHTRLAAEGKPGATMRSGGPYDGWWNGGLRNTAAFHNMIAILTEMIGNPTPQRVPLVMDRQLPSSDLTYPVTPTLTGGLWHFRISIEYSVATNRGVLDIASKMRENFLYNIYKMGRNSIERGSTDTWTPRPHRFAAVSASAAGAARAAAGGGGRGGGVTPEREVEMWAAMHKPEDRDPRAFVIPSTQRDVLTANKFIDALLETGIRVERATREFTAGGKTYPAGSFVVNTNQAFRPHVIDMFEPQDHPDNFAYPGAPPTKPYDNAGWTLAFQMGIEFDRLFDTVKSPALVEMKEWNVTPSPGVVRPAGVGGYLLSHDVLDSFRALNALAGKQIAMLSAPMVIDRQTWLAGSFWVEPSAEVTLTDLAKKIGISARALTVKPDGLVPMRTPRIGLWDQYGGAMEAGWTRWILEQFDFKFDRVFAPQLDAGNLNAKYDVLIFVNGAIPAGGAGRGGRGGGGGAAANALPVPAEYANQQGSISAQTMTALKAFVEGGGTIIAIGSSATNLGAYLQLPMENHLVENGQPLPQTKFYTPGSVLRARVDTASPFAYGMLEHTDVFFDNSPVWTLGADAVAKNVKPIAWFDSKTPLRSGWSWGQAYLDGGVIGVDATVGQGRVLLFGAEILQRAQPYGTFKFLFNGIWTK